MDMFTKMLFQETNRGQVQLYINKKYIKVQVGNKKKLSAYYEKSVNHILNEYCKLGQS